MMTTPEWPPIPPLSSGPLGLCPRCGKGRLFDDFLKLAPRCEVCGLDFSFADPADGPAFFVLCFTCIPAIALGLWIDVAFSPPWWVHLFTSVPAIFVFCVLPLRPLKGWFVASQYVYKAEEGRVAHEDARDR